MHSNEPEIQYNLSRPDTDPSLLKSRASRQITLGRRSGIHLPDPDGRIVLPKHTLNETSGMAGLWFASLDELACFHTFPSHRRHHPFPNVVPFLADHEDHADPQKTRFALHWHAEWHISLYAKFYQGSVYPGGFFPELKPLAISVHNHLLAERWYFLVLAWDREANRCELYLNGVKVAAANRLAETLAWETCGPTLYAGHPRLVLGDITFYEGCPSPEAIAEWAEAEAAETDPDENRQLKRLHLGVGNPSLEDPETSAWEQPLALSLTEPEDLKAFQVQGCQDAVSITSEGLRLSTPQVKPVCLKIPDGDFKQVYVWSRQFFEGDLHVSVEFKPLQPGGLALMVFQAAGMQRESFLQWHEPRPGGEMSFIVDEDIRNYHWEFYREMVDVRNDVATQGLIKNPWLHPLAHGVYAPGIQIGEWHRLDYIQKGGQILGAINGEQVWEATDEVSHGCGPILRAGHIGLRAMIRTDILFRNLTVRQPRFHPRSAKSYSATTYG